MSTICPDMAQSTLFDVSSNTTANLLRIALRGAIDAQAMQTCVDQVATQLPALTKGFTVLTDLSGIQSMDTACVPQVERLMDLCREKGATTIVRVIPKRSKDVGFSILSLFHYPSKVRVVTCSTKAEAEKALA